MSPPSGDAAAALRLATRNIEAVAFDLDGTLLDTVHDLAFALNGLFAERKLASIATVRVANLIGKGMPNLVRKAVADVGGRVPGEPALAALLDRFAVLYADALGKRSVLFVGVADGLARLHAAGYPLAVVTNKARQFIAPHLERAGIAQYFKVCVGAGDATAVKPDPALLRLAAGRLGVSASRLLMVGDSSNDARCARAAGCPVVILPYGYNEGAPVQDIDCDGIVESIAALADLVLGAPAALAANDSASAANDPEAHTANDPEAYPATD